MKIVRKTKTVHEPFKAKLWIYAGTDKYLGSNGDADPAADFHRFPREGFANEMHNDRLFPEVSINAGGMAVVLTPLDVHKLFLAIEEIQIKARRPEAYLGRQVESEVK